MLAGCSTAPKAFVPMPSSRRTAPPPLAAAPAPTQTKTVTLAWDPSPSPGVVRYRLYQGGKSNTYTNSVLTTINTILTVSNLLPKATYYFAAKSEDASANESPFSNEVNYTVPGKRMKLVTQETPVLGSTAWTNVATNYDETTNNSGFYRVVVTED